MLVSGYWIFEDKYPYFIQHQASGIQYLDHKGTIVLFKMPYVAISGGLMSNLIPDCPD
jgi:hypothetical protein